MTLDEKLLILRKQKGLSQEQLAKFASVSRQAVSKWELGESIPDTENIKQLSKIYGVSTDYLLNDNYNCDLDTPILNDNAVALKENYNNKTTLIIALLAIGVGGVGILIMWILSTIIPSSGLVPSNSRDAIFGFSTGSKGSKMNWYANGDVFKLSSFLSDNHLEILFGLCCILVFVGIFLFVHTKIKKNKYNPR